MTRDTRQWQQRKKYCTRCRNRCTTPLCVLLAGVPEPYQCIVSSQMQYEITCTVCHQRTMANHNLSELNHKWTMPNTNTGTDKLNATM